MARKFLFLVVRVAKDAEASLAFEAFALLLEVQPTKLGPHQARGIRLTGHVPADKQKRVLKTGLVFFFYLFK